MTNPVNLLFLFQALTRGRTVIKVKDTQPDDEMMSDAESDVTHL